MSLSIPCAHCGPRPVHEFVYGEIKRVPDALVDPDARDLDRAFAHDNVDGPVLERWFHAFGCRRWSTVARDTHGDDGLALRPDEYGAGRPRA